MFNVHKGIYHDLVFLCQTSHPSCATDVYIHHFGIDSPKLGCFNTNSFIALLKCAQQHLNFTHELTSPFKFLDPLNSHALCKCTTYERTLQC
jgi:hypothetical protein